MLMNFSVVPMIIYMSGMLSFSLKRKHLLGTLLSLELIVVGLFLLLSYYLSYYSVEYYFLMMFLVFSVCEGALGLSVLVSMIRTFGNDFFSSFSVFQC
uniref:NADH-ubiquinone oxidoreductase chain 4L n=1 Tax=Dilar sp. YW-2016 TaxID=1821762 RepID=A0A1S5QY75_9NEOP|nr:NADH dehydrogenase subunit 4L [Dilar sp. YW-2016]